MIEWEKIKKWKRQRQTVDGSFPLKLLGGGVGAEGFVEENQKLSRINYGGDNELKSTVGSKSFSTRSLIAIFQKVFSFRHSI